MIVSSFEYSLERGQRAQTAAFKLFDPSFGDLIDWYGIYEVELLSAEALPRNEVCFLKDRQVLRDGLASHVQPLAQFAKRLSVLSVQPIQQLSAVWIGQGPKNGVIVHSTSCNCEVACLRH
jgi:hypothetical protein